MIDVPDCSLGVKLDIAPERLPLGAWTSALNVHFPRGQAERRGGIFDQFDAPLATPYWLFHYETSAANFWVHAGLADVWVDDGTSRTEITPASDFTGGIDNRWTGGALGGILVMNNEIEPPKFWTGDVLTNLATLTGWDANWRCKALRPWNVFLVAMNITKSSVNYRNMFKLSAPAVPGSVPASWDHTDPASDALEQEGALAQTADRLVDGLPLGDSFIFYKERSMYRMTYIGGNEKVQVQRIPGELGMMARGCAAQIPDGHVVMGTGDIFLFDGGAPRSISEEVRERIYNEMDKDNFERSFVCVNPKREEVLFCYPTRGQTSCNRAAVWNWKTGKWGFDLLPSVTYGAHGLIDDPDTISPWSALTGSWAAYSGKWVGESLSLNETRLMLCRTAPAISAYDFGGTDDGAAIDWHLERTGMGYSDGVKLFKDVYPVFEAPTGTEITIELGAALRPGEAPVYQEPYTFTVGTDFKATLIAKGRSCSVKFSGDSVGKVKLLSFQVGGNPNAGKF
jgi:hypothetical protein